MTCEHRRSNRPGPPKGAVSRRALVGAAWLLSAGAAAAPLTARAGGKVSQQEAHYRTTPNGDARCARCQQFVAPSSCKLVEGAISPSGWCSFFAAQAR